MPSRDMHSYVSALFLLAASHALDKLPGQAETPERRVSLPTVDSTAMRSPTGSCASAPSERGTPARLRGVPCNNKQPPSGATITTRCAGIRKAGGRGKQGSIVKNSLCRNTSGVKLLLEEEA